jgi:hypothetical protein
MKLTKDGYLIPDLNDVIASEKYVPEKLIDPKLIKRIKDMENTIEKLKIFVGYKEN